MTFAIERHSYGEAFFISRRFQIGHAFEGNAAIRHCMLPVFAQTILVCGLEGDFFASAAFANGRRERVYQDSL